MGKNNFIVDVDTGSLVGDFSKISAASAPSFTFGDKREISVSLVKRNSSASSQPWRYVSLEGKTARVALGSQSKTPTDGVFTLSFDGDETSELAAYSTATEVSDALNLLASVIFAGGVSVVAISSHAFRITFNLADGARSAITANTETLQPSSSAFVGDSVEGDSTTKAVQVIFIEVAPSAYVELTDSIANPSLTISTDRAGVVGVTAERKSVAIEGAPHAGTYTLTIDAQTSAAINFNSTVAEIQETLEALPTIGAGKVLVIGDSNDYAIEFSKSLGNVGVMTSDASNLYGALGKTGELNLNVTGLVELLKGYTQASATLEIEIVTTATSASNTIHQSLVSVIQDVIPSTPPAITPFPDYSIVGHTHAISDVAGLQDALDEIEGGEGLENHLLDLANPHAVTAAQVGLSTAAADIIDLQNDTLDLTTAQTAAGAKTFSGQIQATGQSATDDDSVMTRSLARTDTMFQDITRMGTNNWATTFVGSGAINQYESTFRISTGTTTGSSALARGNSGTLFLIAAGNTTSSKITWSQRLRIGFNFSMTQNDANTIMRFQVGETFSKTTISDLDKRGMGLKIVNLDVYALTHDGTTLTTSASLATLPSGSRQAVVMDSDSNGNVSFYLNGSLLVTQTGGPTSNGVANDTAVNFSSQNGAGTKFHQCVLSGDVTFQYGS